MSVDKLHEITPEQQRTIGITALLVGPARALGLLRRVPELFTERHWPHQEDAITIAVCAVSCVAVGARRQAWRVPQRLGMLGEQWAPLVDPARQAPPTAQEIVEALDLHRLLEG